MEGATLMNAETNLTIVTTNKAIDHVTVPVADMDHAERFYVGVLGARPLERFDAPTRVKRRAGSADPKRRSIPLSVRLGSEIHADLFLRRSSPAAEQSPSPIALVVGSADLDMLRARLVSAGVPVDGPRLLGVLDRAAIYFIDPFGNKLELSANAYPGRASEGMPDWHALSYEWRG